MVAQLRAQKKVAALRKRLAAAPIAAKAAYKAKLNAAKANLARITAKAKNVTKNVDGKKTKII